MGVEKCGAKKTDGSGTCEQPAGLGTDHLGVGRCKFHGGATRSHERAGARELARRGLLWYGDPDPDADPGEALLEEVQRTAGHVAWLAKEISEREGPEEGAEPEEASAERLRLSSLRVLYREERDHLVRVCQVALNAGVEERRVRLAEQLGDQLANVLDAIFGELELTPKQRKQAPAIVRRHLFAIEGGREAA